MTLEPTKPPATETPTEEPVLKKDQAYELAVKYKDVPFEARRLRIMEEVPCSRSVAYKAIKRARKQLTDELKPPAERKAAPTIEITGEQPRERPAYLPSEQPPTEEAAIEEIPPIPAEELPDFFRDSLRGTYCLLLSDDGILGKKYGRPKEQVVLCSDSLYRWFSRRIGADELQKYDTILLILNHLTLIGGVVKPYLDDRRKREETKKP